MILTTNKQTNEIIVKNNNDDYEKKKLILMIKILINKIKYKTTNKRFLLIIEKKTIKMNIYNEKKNRNFKIKIKKNKKTKRQQLNN